MEGPDLATKVKYLRAQLRRREFAAAHEAACALRAHHPGNRDVLCILAGSLRGLDRIPEALEVLKDLEHQHPAYGRLFEERGHCHLSRQAIDAAISDFAKAVTLNPWLPESLRTLEHLYRMRGRVKEAEATARFSAKLEKLPREIIAAHGMFVDGEIDSADKLVREYLKSHGDHIEGMRLLARIAMARDMPHDA